MAQPPSAKLLANRQDKTWVWEFEMAKWRPKPDYPDVGPYDGYLIDFPPRWSEYLRAKALEEPKPPVPEITHAEPYFTIRKSAKGGHGAFASQDIPEGTVFHRESPLFSITDHSELESEFRALTKQQQAVIVSMATFDRGMNLNKLGNIFGVNCFRAGEQRRIFAVSCRFNHACPPRNNVSWSWQESIGKMVLTTTRPIKKEEELTLSYGHHPRDFPTYYGFTCDCGCDINEPEVFTEEEAKLIQKLIERSWNSKKKERRMAWKCGVETSRSLVERGGRGCLAGDRTQGDEGSGGGWRGSADWRHNGTR